jgi:hypothetical protein
MKRFFVVAVAGVVAAFAAFAATTWYALEASGVAVVETRAPDGTTRETHVWYAEPEGELWLEAGSPENPWFADASREGRLTLRADERSGDYTATVFEDPAPRARVRQALREKYGWRDRWVGLFVDRRRRRAARPRRDRVAGRLNATARRT